MKSFPKISTISIMRALKRAKIEENSHGNKEEKMKMAQQKKKLGEQGLFNETFFTAVNEEIVKVMESGKGRLCFVSHDND